MSERERFEAIVSSSPYEKSIRRWPDDATTHAWPGSYRDLDVDFAWLVLQDFLARSGQAASGSSQGARSDEAVKRFGIKPWSTLAQLKDDEDLELYVQARIEAEGVGQPEAPTAAPLTDEEIEKIAYESVPPYGAVPNRKRDCLLFARALLAAAHPPARSGAGSEEAQPDRSEES